MHLCKSWGLTLNLQRPASVSMSEDFNGSHFWWTKQVFLRKIRSPAWNPSLIEIPYSQATRLHHIRRDCVNTFEENHFFLIEIYTGKQMLGVSVCLTPLSHAYLSLYIGLWGSTLCAISQSIACNQIWCLLLCHDYKIPLHEMKWYHHFYSLKKFWPSIIQEKRKSPRALVSLIWNN